MVQQRQKARPHSVVWLERELAEARKDLQAAGERIDKINISLAQKNEKLTQALNDRDQARNERDKALRRSGDFAKVLAYR